MTERCRKEQNKNEVETLICNWRKLENTAVRKCVEKKTGGLRRSVRRKWKGERRRIRYCFFFSMARVSSRRTVVWVCGKKIIFTSASGGGGL